MCFLFLRVLRCFTSPRSPSYPIHSGMSNPTSLGLGYPIRTPSDHSSVDNSPRTIAASHVLHRPLVPRHPPCALHNLTTKMLASTIQFSNNNPRQHTPVCSLRHPTAHQQQPTRAVASTNPRAPPAEQHSCSQPGTPHQHNATTPHWRTCICSLERR